MIDCASVIAAVGRSERPARRLTSFTSAAWIAVNTSWRTQRRKKSKTVRGGGNGLMSPRGLDRKGATLTIPGGMITYQVVVRRERVYILQITALAMMTPP
ncbi:hypothetical protein [Streptomyces sp. DSM 40907]|uniref:hypothetical protein n=1 Tax=Streptomyces kutzneri TaxID=3051179 RepID=UPI0028D0C1D2|nr:hypothetical protein [Streptomyces sp. DSM 40907]